jgi:hypothetical protein
MNHQLTVFDLLFILCSGTADVCYLHEDILQVPIPEMTEQSMHNEAFRSYDYDWLRVRFVPEAIEL